MPTSKPQAPLAALLAAALLAGCAADLDPAAIRGALPTAASVALGVPEATPAPGALTVRADGLGQSPLYQSEYAVVSYWTAVAVNTGVGATLGLVRFIVTVFPPSACDRHACTWGPWTGDDGLNRWQLRVEEAGGAAYAWTLSAAPVSPGLVAGWRTILSGVAHAGADADHGHGTFRLDHEAAATLAHPQGWVQEEFGALDVTYDARGAAEVQVVFTGAQSDDPADPHFMNAVYAFRAGAQGGELQVAARRLDDGNGFALRTRWNGAGAGRADVEYLPAAGAPWPLSECWLGEADGWLEVYDTATDPVTGSPDLCPGSMQAPSYSDLVVP